MGELEAEFGRWRRGEISVFELNERIHKFHHGISRELYNLYEPRYADVIVPGAIARGTIRENEVEPMLLENLSDLIQFAKRRRQEETMSEPGDQADGR
ncbi:MAG: hypothetical protein QOJ05_1297 [Verrucomicrobiota bacterium]|jgi:hypothetical protein